jgi:hypothetical protein
MVSGVSVQVSDNKEQLLVFDSAELVAGCHLFYVLCPLYWTAV